MDTFITYPYSYAGYAGNYDDIVYDGEVAEGVFAAYYCQGWSFIPIIS